MLRLGPLMLDMLDCAYLAVIQIRHQTLGVLHQVTLRPDKIHGGLIRLGETPNDEAAGWQWPQSITVVTVLGTAHEGPSNTWTCRAMIEREAA